MLYLAICDEKNRIYKDETALATARTGDVYSELLEEDVIPLPEGSNVMRLPGWNQPRVRGLRPR